MEGNRFYCNNNKFKLQEQFSITKMAVDDENTNEIPTVNLQKKKLNDN